MLRRFYTRVTDSTNAAVASPTVSLLRVGATIVRDASSGTSVIGVRHPGALALNDVCYVIRNGAILAGITITIADPWAYNSANGDWTAEINATGTYTITVGDRLVLTGLSAGHKVSVYDNDVGAGSSGDPTVGSDGTVSGYVDAVDVDVKITSSGTDTYVTDLSTESRNLKSETIASAATITPLYDSQRLVVTGTTNISKIVGCEDGRVLWVTFTDASPPNLTAAATPADDEILVGLSSPTRYKVYTLVGWNDGTYTRWTLGD